MNRKPIQMSIWQAVFLSATLGCWCRLLAPTTIQAPPTARKEAKHSQNVCISKPLLYQFASCLVSGLGIACFLHREEMDRCAASRPDCGLRAHVGGAALAPSLSPDGGLYATINCLSAD